MKQVEVMKHQTALTKILSQEAVTNEDIARAMELLVVVAGVSTSLAMQSVVRNRPVNNDVLEDLVSVAGGVEQIGRLIETSTTIMEPQTPEKPSNVVTAMF